MAKTHVMIDLETLSTATNATVLTIGAVRFDPFGDESVDNEFDRLYIKVDLDSCESLGLDISEDTIAWWGKQSAEAQEEAFGTEGRTPIADAMQQLHKFCWGASRVWSNGSGFDIVICETIFTKLQRGYPWKYWGVRDVRTMFDMGIDPLMPKVTAHNAVEDAVAQAIGVQNVCRVLLSQGVTPFKSYK